MGYDYEVCGQYKALIKNPIINLKVDLSYKI